MDLEDGISLIAKAYEKQAEDRAFKLYLQKYSWMDETNYMSFEEFYKPQQKVDVKSAEEILDEVKGTLDTFKGRWQ